MDSETRPQISVVIVSFNTCASLRECLQTLHRELGTLSAETIVVDNASQDASAEMVKAEFPWVKLIRSDVNLGFGNGNNRAFVEARGHYLVLLNSDAFPGPGALENSLRHMAGEPDVGLGGARLVGRDDSWQPSARLFPSPLIEFLNVSGLAARFPQSRFFGRFDRTWADPDEAADVDWVPGAFSIVRRELLETLGYFDPAFFLYYEEVDLCRRIKAAGWRIRYWPDVVVTHVGGESSRTVAHLDLAAKGSQLSLWRMRSQLLYYRKHHSLFTAWVVMQIERCWHKLRAWKNVRGAGPDSRTKAVESHAIVTLWKQAWQETRGGLVSPPQPW